MTFKSKLSEKSLSFIDLQKVIEDYMSHLRRCLILNLFLSSALSDSGLVFVVDKSSRVVSFLGGEGMQTNRIYSIITGFSLRTLAAGERFNIAGEYFSRGSTSE